VLSAFGADDTFRLGTDYTEWLYPNAGLNSSQLATDRAGAVYILSIIPGTSLSNPPKFLVTKISSDGKTIVWENNLGFGVTAMAVDPDGGVYVLSSLASPSPEAPPPESLFVSKLGFNSSGIAWKVNLPFTSVVPQYGSPLKADSQGRAYVAGTIGSISRTGAIVRVKADGSGIDYTAQISGFPSTIAVDASGGAYAAGSTAANTSFLTHLLPDGSPGFTSSLPRANSGIQVGVDPQGSAVVYSGGGAIQHGILRRFDATGALTFSTDALPGVFPNLAIDATGNIYLTGSAATLTRTKNSLATCGLDMLAVIAPDGSVLQSTYIAGGVGGTPLVATGTNSMVFLMDTAQPLTFTPSQSGPFAPVRPANSSPGTEVLWRLSPNANAPTVSLACLGNGGSYASYNGGAPIAPGTLISLFGNGLGPPQGYATQATALSPYPTQAAGVEVTFDGKSAPLLWAQDEQINAVAPWSLTPGQTTQVCVSYQGIKTNCLMWPVAQASPGVFTLDGVHAAALNQDGTLNSADNPSPVGSIVSVFSTGLGPIVPVQADGDLIGLPLPANVLQPVVQAIQPGVPPLGATFTNLEVIFAGPAPFLVAGVTQINFRAQKYQGSIYVQLFTPSNPFQIYIAGQ
jgi:uncharacterized protein (TIGR03437 family)